MNKKLAKIKYLPNKFEIIENGDHVLCAISGKPIRLEELNYPNLFFYQIQHIQRSLQVRLSENYLVNILFLLIFYTYLVYTLLHESFNHWKWWKRTCIVSCT